MKKTLSIIFIILLVVIIVIWYTVCREKEKKHLPTALKTASGEVTGEFQFHDSVMFEAVDLSPRTGYSVRVLREDGHIERDLRLVSDSLGRIP